MAIVNIQDRLNQTAEEILKKIKMLAKKKSVRIAHTDSFIHDSKVSITIETDSPEWVLDELKYDIVPKSKYGMFVSGATHAGFFDWAADTYIKDSVTILVKI